MHREGGGRGRGGKRRRQADGHSLRLDGLERETESRSGERGGGGYWERSSITEGPGREGGRGRGREGQSTRIESVYRSRGVLVQQQHKHTHTHTQSHAHRCNSLSLSLSLSLSHTHTDGVDPAIAPSTGTAVRGGLTFREAHYLVEAISESGNLGSLDMVFSCSRYVTDVCVCVCVCVPLLTFSPLSLFVASPVLDLLGTA